MDIRCMIAQEDGLYIAVTLEFGLAAQAETRNAAISKLEAQVNDYLTGASAEEQVQLLTRRGPFTWYLSYYWLQLCGIFTRSNSNCITLHLA